MIVEIFVEDVTGKAFEDGTCVLDADTTAGVHVKIGTDGEYEIADDPADNVVGICKVGGKAGEKAVVIKNSRCYRTNAFTTTPSVGQYVKNGADGRPEGVAQGSWNSSHVLRGVVTAVSGNVVTVTQVEG